MITASLVLYNTQKKEILTLLSCVENSIISKLIVIDQSDDGNDREILFSESKKTEYYIKVNEGYGSGHNMAIQKLKDSKYHIILNPDIQFDPQTISFLKEYMENKKNKEVGLIMPKVVYPDGQIQYLCKLLPRPYDIFIRKFGTSKMKKNIDLYYNMRLGNYEQEMNIPILSGCFMFFRTEILKSLNGFDSRFFLYFEDFDLSRRAYMIAKNMYIPTVSIIHAHKAEHKTNRKILWISFLSAIKYFNKWGWFFDKERKHINKRLKDLYLN